MRPAILPISETRSKYTTLNFQDFHMAEPSLARNKWSEYDLDGGLWSKPQSVTRMCTKGDGYQLPHGSIPPHTGIPGMLLIDPGAGPTRGTAPGAYSRIIYIKLRYN